MTSTVLLAIVVLLIVSTRAVPEAQPMSPTEAMSSYFFAEIHRRLNDVHIDLEVILLPECTNYLFTYRFVGYRSRTVRHYYRILMRCLNDMLRFGFIGDFDAMKKLDDRLRRMAADYGRVERLFCALNTSKQRDMNFTRASSSATSDTSVATDTSDMAAIWFESSSSEESAEAPQPERMRFLSRLRLQVCGLQTVGQSLSFREYEMVGLRKQLGGKLDGHEFYSALPPTSINCWPLFYTNILLAIRISHQRWNALTMLRELLMMNEWSDARQRVDDVASALRQAVDVGDEPTLRPILRISFEDPNSFLQLDFHICRKNF